MEEQEKVFKPVFNEIENIESLCCVLGLNFNDSANEFQKAFLTLAHLMASCRDFVLKGSIVPDSILKTILDLSGIIYYNCGTQKTKE